MSFVWEETGVPGQNPRGRAGDDLTFPHTTPEIEPRPSATTALPDHPYLVVMTFLKVCHRDSKFQSQVLNSQIKIEILHWNVIFS